MRLNKSDGDRGWDGPSFKLVLSGFVLVLLGSLLVRSLMDLSPTMVRSLLRELLFYTLVAVGSSWVVSKIALRWSRELQITLWATIFVSSTLIVYVTANMAGVMFESSHDRDLLLIFLLVAVIVAAAFGFSVSTRLTNDLEKLMMGVRAIERGDLQVRIDVERRDEIAELGLALNQMAERLESAARIENNAHLLRRDLIAWTSHDLRTPLTSVRALVEALHDGLVTEPESVQRYYKMIRTDIIDLTAMIDDLFELSQLDTESQPLEKNYHSLSDILSDTVERFHLIAEQKGISLRGEVAGDIDPVMLNAVKMSRVVNNLVGNAVRYTPKGGEIVVCAERREAYVWVEIRDDGPGFSDTDLPRVFERFYRGEQARTRATGGAGLGLAIAEGLVTAHGGEIWARNRSEGGAVVGFMLPVDG
ncbi:MAG TPA: HAMP domain-containing sensor histidine kinase [Anaerolineae bacterium]|nr:HAMP domain-containing sensor histidine kinase [Anaerolineae bacterium]